MRPPRGGTARSRMLTHCGAGWPVSGGSSLSSQESGLREQIARQAHRRFRLVGAAYEDIAPEAGRVADHAASHRFEASERVSIDIVALDHRPDPYGGIVSGVEALLDAPFAHRRGEVVQPLQLRPDACGVGNHRDRLPCNKLIIGDLYTEVPIRAGEAEGVSETLLARQVSRSISRPVTLRRRSSRGESTDRTSESVVRARSRFLLPTHSTHQPDYKRRLSAPQLSEAPADEPPSKPPDRPAPRTIFASRMLPQHPVDRVARPVWPIHQPSSLPKRRRKRAGRWPARKSINPSMYGMIRSRQTLAVSLGSGEPASFITLDSSLSIRARNSPTRIVEPTTEES